MMVYGSQKGRGFNDIFGTLTSTFKPIAEGAANVRASLATGLVTDLLSGKTPKTSIKERGNQAKGMIAQRALQGLQGGRGDVSPSSMGWSDKAAIRKRSRSKSQPPAKRKRKSQTGYLSPYSLSSWELSWLRYSRELSSDDGKRDYFKNEKPYGKRL